MGLKKGYDSPSILWEFYWNVHVCTHIKRVCLSAQISLHKIASCFTSLYEQRIQCYNARENKVGTHRDMFIVSGYPIFVMSCKNPTCWVYHWVYYFISQDGWNHPRACQQCLMTLFWETVSIMTCEV